MPAALIQSGGYTCLLSLSQQFLAIGTRREGPRLLAPARSLYAQFERGGSAIGLSVADRSQEQGGDGSPCA